MVNRLHQKLLENLPADVTRRLPAELLNPREIQTRIRGFSQEDIARRLSVAISELDESRVQDFNQAISGYARTRGIRLPQSGSVSASPETALMLASILRGSGGLAGIVSLLKDPRIAAVVLPVVRRMIKT